MSEERRNLVFSVGSNPILETHRRNREDKSQLHMVSAELLAYYQRIEAELAAIAATSPARDVADKHGI